MTQRMWGNEYRTTTVCVDSYQEGVLEGRFSNPCGESGEFKSLSQFLLKMESLLDEMKFPQAYTAARTFAPAQETHANGPPLTDIYNGALATFEVKVIFRQHASWQGVIIWLEKGKEERFRSVLELVLLMDSALRENEVMEGDSYPCSEPYQNMA